MTLHPATLMLRTWLTCIALFLILPFQLLERTVLISGYVVLVLLIAGFITGSFLASPVIKEISAVPKISIDLRLVDKIIVPVTIIAIGLLLIDLAQQGFLDLSSSFIERNDRATALLTGSDVGGSVYFQIGFLLFPASYAYVVRIIAFEQRISLWKLALFGFFPPVLTSLTTGGRGSLLYALIIALLALQARKRMVNRSPGLVQRSRRWNPLPIVLMVIVGLISLNYFVQVFVVRVEGFGGIENAMDHAARAWGVSFEGDRAVLMRKTLGDGNTYLIFVFAWYIVQGLVISNEIFSFYSGPPAFGIYGIDLITAVIRRVDGDIVANRLFGLFDLNIYGFLPSAFGSLFVDLRYWAFPMVILWGYLAGMVYKLTKISANPRWFLAAPFVTGGIIFSLLNTPLGFNNGLMTHLWLIVALLASRTARDKGATLNNRATA
ncbi:hypothetical protein [Sphingomonas sp. 37zxx]|uniref:hypothetical protein n=1 Tax=Sphingomonas sp. 37zxx TaxID=1550073 RepID=UPI00053BFBE6|nr:hypothetical protein [Sphingomonas sp. 37zxx]